MDTLNYFLDKYLMNFWLKKNIYFLNLGREEYSRFVKSQVRNRTLTGSLPSNSPWFDSDYWIMLHNGSPNMKLFLLLQANKQGVPILKRAPNFFYFISFTSAYYCESNKNLQIQLQNLFLFILRYELTWGTRITWWSSMTRRVRAIRTFQTIIH